MQLDSLENKFFLLRPARHAAWRNRAKRLTRSSKTATRALANLEFA
jgi:hypothetical protein